MNYSRDSELKCKTAMSVSDLTHALLCRMITNSYKHTSYPCGKPSQNSWSCLAAEASKHHIKPYGLKMLWHGNNELDHILTLFTHSFILVACSLYTRLQFCSCTTTTSGPSSFVFYAEEAWWPDWARVYQSPPQPHHKSHPSLKVIYMCV